MSFAGSDTALSRPGLHSRIALALAHAAVDSKNKQNIIPYGSTIRADATVDYVQQIIDESANEWSTLINHPFPRSLANGTAPLNGFRHYMIQDATYLEYYYRVRMESVSKTGSFDEVVNFAATISNSLGYVTSARSDCTTKLGVPADVVATEPKSDQLQNSINLYQGVVENGDWLDIYIVLSPCILGYDVIANGLLWDPDTVRNTPYFPLWIQANAGGSSASRYRTFINANIGLLSDEERQRRWPTFIDNFKKACGTEAAFLGLGSPGAFPAYDVVPGGPYVISSYRSGNHYLAANSSSGVVTVETQPSSEGVWDLVNTTNGYTVQNRQYQSFLSVTITQPIQPTYEVNLSAEQQPWSINPVTVYNPDGSPLQAYQLFVPPALQFVLDAGYDPTNPKVFVANNSGISSQLWLLTPVLQQDQGRA